MTIKETRNLIEEKGRELESWIRSGRYAEILVKMSNFSKYSFINQMMMILQDQNATHVEGFKAWKKYGRYVKKGGKALQIIAPIVVKKQVSSDTLDLLESTTSENEETEIKNVVIGFSRCYVFDISQTDGAPLPDNSINESQQGTISIESATAKLIEMVASRGYSFSYASDLGKGILGLTNHQAHTVQVLDSLQPLQSLSVLAHEVGHMITHADVKRDFSDWKNTLQAKEMRECQAESIALVVLSSLGFDVNNSSFEYITSWTDGQLTHYRKSMNLITKSANEIINYINA